MSGMAQEPARIRFASENEDPTNLLRTGTLSVPRLHARRATRRSTLNSRMSALSVASRASVKSTVSQLTSATRDVARIGRVKTLEYELSRNVSFVRTISSVVEPQKPNTQPTPLQRCLKLLAMAVLLPGVPASMAIRVVGFKAVTADDGKDYSVMVPLIAGSLLLFVPASIILILWHGLKEYKVMFTFQYVIVLVPAVFNAGIFAFGNLALKAGLSGTNLRLAMKVGIALNVVGEVWLTKKKPYLTQVLTIAALLFSVLVFGLDSSGSGGSESTMLGWVFGLLSSVSTTIFSCVYEAVARSFAERASNRKAEPLRLLVVLEFWKFFAQALVLCIIEPQFLGHLFDGWSYTFAAGAVLPTPVQLIFCNTAIMVIGALRQQVVAALDLPITYILEAVVFGTPVELQKCLLIVVITLMVMTYMFFNIEVRRAVALGMTESAEAENVCKIGTDTSSRLPGLQTSVSVPSVLSDVIKTATVGSRLPGLRPSASVPSVLCDGIKTATVGSRLSVLRTSASVPSVLCDVIKTATVGIPEEIHVYDISPTVHNDKFAVKESEEMV